MGGPIRLGVVAAFDSARGLGSVSEESGASWPFHCTQIADGTREIDVGSPVVFRVTANHLGRMEAVEVTKLETPPSR